MRKNSSNKQSTRSLFNQRSKERNWGGDGTLICPDSVRVKLPFTQTLTPGTTSGGLYSYQYRGNSCFDPDYTGTGLQPNGFDQWTAFYNMYVVLGSEIIVEYLASTQAAMEIVVVPAFNTALPANTKEAAGWRYARTQLAIPTGNGVKVTMRSRMSTATICGVPDEEVMFGPDFSAAISASPASLQTWYWDVFVQNISNSTTLADILRVTLVFDIKFMAPVQQAFSAVRRPALLPPSEACCTFTAAGPEPPRVVDEVCCCARCKAK
jgi:hypothetical protein